MPKRGAALLAALAAAALLAACGSSGSDTTGGSTAAAPAQGSGSTSQAGSGATSGGGGGEQPRGGREGGSGGGSAAVAPLRVSGGGSGQYRTKGGDNSIQDFGEESGESELQEAAEALHAFYAARAGEDWAQACAHMSKAVTGELEALAARSPQIKARGCPAALQALTQPLPPAVERESTVVDAGSLRHEGERAFLIYTGAGKAVYAMPMRREGGGWKVGLLAATPLD